MTIPGYMVLAAIIYAGLTSATIVVLGRPLIRRVEAKNAGEARLRYELTRVRDSAENIALIGGDDDERERLEETFGALAGALAQGDRAAGAHHLRQQRQHRARAGRAAPSRRAEIPRRAR